MSTSATYSRDFAETAAGFRPDTHRQADRLARLVELSGCTFVAPASGELLWLCDGLCRDAARREPETGDDRF